MPGAASTCWPAYRSRCTHCSGAIFFFAGLPGRHQLTVAYRPATVYGYVLLPISCRHGTKPAQLAAACNLKLRVVMPDWMWHMPNAASTSFVPLATCTLTWLAIACMLRSLGMAC